MNHRINMADWCRPLLKVVNNLMSTTLLCFSVTHRLLWAGDIYSHERDLFSSSELEWSGVAGFFICSLSPVGCFAHFPVSSGKLNIIYKVFETTWCADGPQSNKALLLGRHCLINGFISLQANQHSVESISELRSSNCWAGGAKEPDTSHLMSRHPRPRLRATAVLQKVCQGSKSMKLRCQECRRMMAPSRLRGSSISGSVGGSYGSIILLQLHHFMQQSCHIHPCSLHWNISF